MIIDLLDPKEKLDRIMTYVTFECRHCGLAFDNFYLLHKCCRLRRYKEKRP